MIEEIPRDLEPEPVEERLVGAERVIAVLMELAAHPAGVTLEELAAVLRSPKSSVHRALAILRKAGLAELAARGVYVLGDEYLRLAFRNLDDRPDTIRIQPLLEELTDRFGETAHYAFLSGREVVYRAKADPASGAMRLTSVVGGRNPAYRTAVGKALLSTQLHSVGDMQRVLGTTPLEKKTPNTLTDPTQLLSDLDRTRRRGYAVDDQENELGVNCVAIPILRDGLVESFGAISVSGVTVRCSLQSLEKATPEIRDIIERHLGADALVSPSAAPARKRPLARSTPPRLIEQEMTPHAN